MIENDLQNENMGIEAENDLTTAESLTVQVVDIPEAALVINNVENNEIPQQLEPEGVEKNEEKHENMTGEQETNIPVEFAQNDTSFSMNTEKISESEKSEINPPDSEKKLYNNTFKETKIQMPKAEKVKTPQIKKPKLQKKVKKESFFSSTMKSMFSTLSLGSKPKKPVNRIFFDTKTQTFRYSNFKGSEITLEQLRKFKGRVEQLVKYYENMRNDR